MSRPMLMRATPHALRGAVYYRWYKSRSGQFSKLFDSASLVYAPAMRMYDLVPTDGISQCIAFMGFFELNLSRRIASAARRGGLLIDVGANMGYFSLLWLQQPGNRAVAFEPVPRNLELLNRNFEKNHCSDRVQLVASACADKAGTLQLDIGPDAQTGWGSLAVTDQARCIEVPVTRVDDMIDGDERVAILKIDAEGADPLVLRGCEKLLSRRMIDEIYFEQNHAGLRRMGLDEREPFSLLESYGYQLSCLGHPDDRTPTWVARLV